MRNEELKEYLDGKFNAIEENTQAIAELKEQGHLCKFSEEDIQGLKSLAKMAREGNKCLRGIVYKFIFLGILGGLLWLLGDKAKNIIEAFRTLF